MKTRSPFLRALGVCLGIIVSFVAPAINGAAQPAPPSPPPSPSPTVHNWRPIRLPPDQVNPPPPSNLHPGAPVPVEPAPVRPTKAAIQPAAAGTCYGATNNPAVSHHAYSQGFTTCGTAIGVYALWVPDTSKVMTAWTSAVRILTSTLPSGIPISRKLVRTSVWKRAIGVTVDKPISTDT